MINNRKNKKIYLIFYSIIVCTLVPLILGVFFYNYHSIIKSTNLVASAEGKTEISETKETLTLNNNYLIIKIKIDDEISEINLKVRSDAEKYICDDKNINKEKLANFLTYAESKGIMPSYALEFCFEDFIKTINDLLVKKEVKSENAKLVPVVNSGNVKLKSAIYGKEFDKNSVFLQIFNNLVEKLNLFSLNYKTLLPEYDDKKIMEAFNLRGSFYTTYVSSNTERKSNIELAMSKLDGLTLYPGEILSFNETTGRRSEENGYYGAKIIVNGEFVEGVGGGVCQASTTLYNACLVSGLSVLEANPHSLKVNYIAPSFDAMVNFGSSDLKIKNNTDMPITFATKCDGVTCSVFVYGAKNEYKILRRSEVISEKPPLDDEVIYASEEEYDFKNEDYIYKTYPKNRVESEGYLEYYKNGVLEKTEKIRHNVYNSIRGVKIVKNS